MEESINTLSRDTAAVDELRKEFVHIVLKSDCKCQLKNESYQIRGDKAEFIEPSIFLNWWFSWAANIFSGSHVTCMKFYQMKSFRMLFFKTKS